MEEGGTSQQNELAARGGESRGAIYIFRAIDL